MNRFAFVFALRPDALPEYERRHDEIWPEMLELLDSVGIDDYSIFTHDHLLFAVLKCRDPWPVTASRLAASPVQARWNEAMADLIEWQLDEAGNLRELREVFRFESGGSS
jgi:L-rhamnose mutarotase